MQISPNMLAMLRLAYNMGTIPFDNWKRMDQRSIRALYIRGNIRIGRSGTLTVTHSGIEDYEKFYKNGPNTRKNPQAPVFKLYQGR